MHITPVTLIYFYIILQSDGKFWHICDISLVSDKFVPFQMKLFLCQSSLTVSIYLSSPVSFTYGLSSYPTLSIYRSHPSTCSLPPILSFINVLTSFINTHPSSICDLFNAATIPRSGSIVRLYSHTLLHRRLGSSIEFISVRTCTCNPRFL